MSRIGKIPIVLPPKVKVEVKGRAGFCRRPERQAEHGTAAPHQPEGGRRQDCCHRDGDEPKAKALHGLSRALVWNMVKGVSDGFVKKLEIQGVGFKAAVQGKIVNMSLGYSHPINYPIPDQVKVTVEENTKLTIEGPDKRGGWPGGLGAPQLLSAGTLQGQGRALRGRTCPAQGRQDGSIMQLDVHGQIREIKMRTDKKQKLARLRHWRVRRKVSGTKDRPRMSVCFTNQNIHVQFIDDAQAALRGGLDHRASLRRTGRNWRPT